MNTNYHISLFKREFLQHKGALIISPMVLLCLTQIGALFAVYELLTVVNPGTTLTIDNQAYYIGKDLDSLVRNEDFQFKPIYGFIVFALMLCLFYLLDSLYADRKDRSILFWRSLPISEFENVGIKLITSALIIPGVFFIVGMISLTFAALILYAGILLSGVELEHGIKFIAYVSGLGSASELFLIVMLFSVFLVPIHMGLLVMSAAARRSPWLTLILPLLGISILELMVFHEIKFGAFIGRYIETAIKTSEAIVTGGNQSLSVMYALSAIFVSITLYLACVFLRQRKFEI